MNRLVRRDSPKALGVHPCRPGPRVLGLYVQLPVSQCNYDILRIPGVHGRVRGVSCYMMDDAATRS